MPGITLSITSGERAGTSATFDQPFILIGRHPQADLRFAPAGELTISSRHAALVRRDALYVVRDLGSTNGTYVNGSRIESERVLGEGDVIQLGVRGPTLRFGYARDQSSAGPATVIETAIPSEVIPRSPPGEGLRPQAGPPTPSPRSPLGDVMPPPPQAPPRTARPFIVMPDGGTETRINRAVLRHTSSLRWLVAGLLALVLAGGAVGVWWNARNTRRLAREQAQLMQQMDNLLTRIRAVADSNAAVRGALQQAADEATRLRQLVAQARANSSELAALRGEVQRASRRQEGLAAAASLDARAAVRASGWSVVAVGPDPDMGLGAGAAFAAGGREGGRLLLTSARLTRRQSLAEVARVPVRDRDGRRRDAEVLARHPSLDLALLQVPGTGERIKGLEAGRSLAAGQPVVIIGPDGQTVLAAVSRVLPEVVQLDVFGGAVLSGSPVCDAQGALVGIVSEPESASGGRIIYAVSVDAARAFVAALGDG